MAAIVIFAASAGLLLRAPMPRMALVDDFSISKVIKDVRVFDGDYATEICKEVESVAKMCIEEKGSFSLAIPGGSVVEAVKGLDTGALDMSKVHIFLVNEKVPSYPCAKGSQEVAEKWGLPKENVHAFKGEGTPAEQAASYTELLNTHPSIDNSGAIPSPDMMLLGTGPDGHCGCIFPDSPEVKAFGSGQVVLAGNDDRADGDFLAVSMDVMCATKNVLVSAAAAGRSEMVAKALSGDFGPCDCPAGLVEAQQCTLWFTDTESIAGFEGEMEDEDEQ
jgi:6-phosphogluconolactonase